MSRVAAIHLHYVARGRKAFRHSGELGRGKAVHAVAQHPLATAPVEVIPCISRLQSDLQNEGRIRKEVFVCAMEEGQWEHGKDLIRSYCI